MAKEGRYLLDDITSPLAMQLSIYNFTTEPYSQLQFSKIHPLKAIAILKDDDKYLWKSARIYFF